MKMAKSISAKLSIGDHIVTEVGPAASYQLSTVTGCTRVGDTLGATATVTQGGTTTCVFSNLVNKGTITVVKDAEPNDAQDFSFSGALGAFSLDDDADATLSNTKVSAPLFPGSYTITENATSGWTLAQLSCVSGQTPVGKRDGNVVSFSLNPGENITCTFTNTRDEFCGDGVKDENEACDYGSLNGSSTCSQRCQWNAPVCSQESMNVTNGEFEVSDVTAGAGWDIFNNAQVPGFTAAWYGGSSTFGNATRPEPKIELHGGVNGWTSGSDQYVELDTDWDGPSGSLNGEPASIALSQTIPTVVGNEYTVTWDYAARPNHGDNRLSFKVNGSEKFDSGNKVGGGSVAWTVASYTFTADTVLTTITFTETGTPDSLGMFLDNVRVTCLGQSEVKICKVDGNEKGLSGWNVFLKGDKVDTVSVLPNGLTYSSVALPTDDYILEANGTYTYRPGTSGAEYTDAELFEAVAG